MLGSGKACAKCESSVHCPEWKYFRVLVLRMKYLTTQLKNLWLWNTKHKRDKVVGKVIHHAHGAGGSTQSGGTTSTVNPGCVGGAGSRYSPSDANRETSGMALVGSTFNCPGHRNVGPGLSLPLDHSCFQSLSCCLRFLACLLRVPLRLLECLSVTSELSLDRKSVV